MHTLPLTAAVSVAAALHLKLLSCSKHAAIKGECFSFSFNNAKPGDEFNFWKYQPQQQKKEVHNCCITIWEIIIVVARHLEGYDY